jgi:hypothetical protein
MPDEEIKSVSDLINKLKEGHEAYNGEIWFRGQGVNTWKLLPGILRTQTQVSEYTLFKKFKQNTNLLLLASPKNDFEWMFLMQHFGAPTRLLDWTELPLVALYFACEEKHNENDGTFWILKPTELNKNANIDSDRESFYIPHCDEQIVESYSYERYRQDENSRLLPIAILATRNNERIQAQQGTFTIHHKNTTSIEDVGDKEHIRRFTIPSTNKADIRNELKNLGIAEFQLFPELATIGKMVRELRS